MVQLQNHYQTFKALDAEVITVQREEREGVAGLKKTRAATKIEFPIVLDYQNKQTGAYSQGAFFTYIIDKQGVIRTIVPGTVYERPSGNDILEALKNVVSGKDRDQEKRDG